MRLSSLLSLVAVFLAVVLTVGAAAFTYVNVRQVVAESPIELPPPPQAGSLPTASPLLSLTPTIQVSTPAGTQAANQNPGQTPTVSTWHDPSRVTILLLGIDQRQ